MDFTVQKSSGPFAPLKYSEDIGPDGGSGGGEVVFTGTPKEMIECGDTITASYLRKDLLC